MKVKNAKLLVSSLVIISILILDQVSKILVVRLNADYVCNSGYAFGILQEYLNVLLVLLVLVVAFYNFSKTARFNLYLGWAFVLGGGLGNMVDRLMRGCVVDFINLKIWPSFNVADAAITVGVVILVYSLFFSSKKKV